MFFWSKKKKKIETDKEIGERLYQLSDKKDYGICPSATDAQVAFNELAKFFLGDDFYISLPISNAQCNTELLYEIETRYKKCRLRKKIINM